MNSKNPKNKSAKKILGDRSETIASQFLYRKGFNILDKNIVFHNLGELDLVLQHQLTQQIVFVEVRSVSKSFIHPTQILSLSKQQKLKKTARYWLYVHRMSEYVQDWRLDLVVIEYRCSQTPLVENLDAKVDIHWYKYIL